MCTYEYGSALSTSCAFCLVSDRCTNDHAEVSYKTLFPIIASVVSIMSLSLSLRCPVPSRLCSWRWPSWRLGTSALPYSTAKRPSWHQRERSLTLHSSTSCTFPTTRSLPSTYRSSCPCACLFCYRCSKSCLRPDRDAEKSKPRWTERKKRKDVRGRECVEQKKQRGTHEERLICSVGMWVYK